MLKRATIQTVLVSVTENGEDVIRTESTGGCLIEENGVMLRYAEKENKGTATLLLTDTLADLKRRGDTTSRMTFVQGRMLPCPYHTGRAGDIDLSIYTHKTDFTLSPAGGRFSASFSVMIAGRQVADNTLTVEWKHED